MLNEDDVKPAQGYIDFARLRHLMHVCLEKARTAERDWNQGLKETKEVHPELLPSAAEIRWAESVKAKTLYSTGMRELAKTRTYALAALVEQNTPDHLR